MGRHRATRYWGGGSQESTELQDTVGKAHRKVLSYNTLGDGLTRSYKIQGEGLTGRY